MTLALVLTAPAFLWAALLALPLIALYLIRVQRRAQTVAYLRLWEELLVESRARSLFERLKRWFSLLLQLLILVLLVAALCEPSREARELEARQTLVVLDASASMQVREASGKTRFELALEQARRDLGRTRICSPIDGTITGRGVNQGDLVARLTGSETHYIVSDLRQLLVYTDVDEGDVVEVQRGQPARVSVNALGSQQLTGAVYSVGYRAQQAQGEQVSTFTVRVLLKQNRGDKRLNEIRALAEAHRVELQELNSRDLHRACPEVHQGVAVEVVGTVKQKSLPAFEDFIKTLGKGGSAPLLLVLDGVTDPHNLGACLRSADAAGVDAVIIPRDKAVGLNATVRRVASGAADTVKLFEVTNLARTLVQLQEHGIWLVGTDDEAAQDIYEQDLSGPLAVVMGSEGQGLRRLTKEKCDFLVSIPMAGAMSSLNVSVATGVALFEAVRQRRG